MRLVRWSGLAFVVAAGWSGIQCTGHDAGFSGEEVIGDDDTEVVTESEVEVIFTEVMANPAGVEDSDGEWFELYNLGGDEIDLTDFRVTDASGTSFLIKDVTIQPGDYLVFGRNDDEESNGGVIVSFEYDDDFTLANQDESLTLEDTDGNLVDAISYEKAPDGASLSLDPEYFDPSSNDDPAYFCSTAYTEMNSGDLGTPGDENDRCFVNASEGDLIFTEIMANPATVADTEGEYLELYNNSNSTIELVGWVLTDGKGGEHIISNPDLTLEEGEYLLLGRHFQSTENGGLDIDYSWGDDLELDDTSSTLQVLAGDTVVDAVTYGATGFPSMTEGISVQLQPSAYSSTMNDDGANWCPSTSQLSGGDYGTAGAENVSCSSS